ncbi:unnamed protein product, partial [marine sediment metagenome]
GEKTRGRKVLISSISLGSNSRFNGRPDKECLFFRQDILHQALSWR